MRTTAPSQPRARPSQSGTADRRTTRDRLLAAAVRLLQDEGIEALSTTRLTQEVGIVQSGFYSHFASLDDCVAAATSLIVQEIRGPLHLWLEELRGQEPAAEELVLERLTVHFTRVLDILLPRRAFLELLVRYRRTPGTLGEALSALHAELVSDVRRFLKAVWVQAGLPTRRQANRLTLLATLIVDLVMTATDVVATSRSKSTDVAVETLAMAAISMVAAGMEATARAEGMPVPR